MTNKPSKERTKLPGGYERMLRPAGDHHYFDSCTRCGEQIEHGGEVYFMCADAWWKTGTEGELPFCSLDCARASREEA